MVGSVEEGRLGRPFSMRDLILLCGLAGLFLGWNAPNHYPPWPAFHLEYAAACGACLIGLAVFAWPTAADGKQGAAHAAPAPRTIRLPLPAATRIWVLAALWPVLQYLTGGLPFFGDAVIGLLYGLGVALCIYAGHLWGAQEGSARVLRLLFLTMVVSSLAANGMAIVQWLRLGTPGWWAMQLIDDRPYANLAQPNHFGLLMVFAIVAVTALFESAAITSRSIYGLALAYFGWGVVISQSRASMLALLAVVLCWLATQARTRTRLQMRFVLPATAAACLLAVAYAPIQEALLLSTAGPRDGTEVGPRQWIWLHFWAAIMERPWAGYGFNQAVLALAEVAERVHPSRNAVFAHNVVLDLMAWFGIPLALAMSAAFMAWMASWLRRAPNPTLMAERHWVFAIWLAVLVQSLLEFPYAHTYFLLPAALLAGAITPARMLDRPTLGAVRVGPGRVAATLVVATASTLGWLGWEYFQLEDDFRLSRFERANFSGQAQERTLESPLLLDQLGALNASARFAIVPHMPPDQLQALGVLARRFHILSTRMDYAKALALNGRLAESESELTIILSVYDQKRGERIGREWRAWLAEHQTSIEQFAQRPSVQTAPR